MCGNSLRTSRPKSNSNSGQYNKITYPIFTDVLSYAVTEFLLHLRQPRCLQGTGILAGGVDQINGRDLALDQIILEMNLLALLRNELDIGEVALVWAVAGHRMCQP
jgi:hypothetical protein